MADATEKVSLKFHDTILALTGEYQSASRTGLSRQRVAYAAMKRPDLIEREWQDGCAQCTYYRLTEAGLAARAALLSAREGV